MKKVISMALALAMIISLFTVGGGDVVSLAIDFDNKQVYSDPDMKEGQRAPDTEWLKGKVYAEFNASVPVAKVVWGLTPTTGTAGLHIALDVRAGSLTLADQLAYTNMAWSANDIIANRITYTYSTPTSGWNASWLDIWDNGQDKNTVTANAVAFYGVDGAFLWGVNFGVNAEASTVADSDPLPRIVPDNELENGDIDLGEFDLDETDSSTSDLLKGWQTNGLGGTHDLTMGQLRDAKYLVMKFDEVPDFALNLVTQGSYGWSNYNNNGILGANGVAKDGVYIIGDGKTFAIDLTKTADWENLLQGNQVKLFFRYTDDITLPNVEAAYLTAHDLADVVTSVAFTGTPTSAVAAESGAKFTPNLKAGTATVSGKALSVKVDGTEVASATSATEYTLPPLTPGKHEIAVSWAGDAGYLASTNKFEITVNPYVTSITFGTHLSAINLGDAFTVTPTLKAGDTPLDGRELTIFDGTKEIATATSATATSITGLAVGIRTIVFKFAGDATYAATQSSLTVHVVNPALPETVLTGTGNPSGSIVEGTDVVIIPALKIKDGADLPGKTLTVWEGNTQIATATSFTACTLTSLSVGTHNINVKFAGDDEYNAAATDWSFTVIVEAAVVTPPTTEPGDETSTTTEAGDEPTTTTEGDETTPTTEPGGNAPAQTDPKTGIKVEGVPDGMNLVVKSATVAKGNLPTGTAKAMSYTISLTDADGVTVNQDGSYTITLPVPEGYNGDHILVYHMVNGKPVVISATIKDGKIVFTTTTLGEFLVAEATGEWNVPQTGDNALPIAAALVLLFSVAGLVIMTRKGKATK